MLPTRKSAANRSRRVDCTAFRGEIPHPGQFAHEIRFHDASGRTPAPSWGPPKAETRFENGRRTHGVGRVRFAFRPENRGAYNVAMRYFIDRVSLCVAVPCIVWLALDCAFRIVIGIPFFPGSVGIFAFLGLVGLLVRWTAKYGPDEVGKP
jgi:hypothetical protein